MAMLRKGRAGRPAAALVETAAVCAIFLMVLFGVFEYCRLLWVRQMVENAAREGARYAIVNTADPNLVANTQAVVTTRMSGLQNALLNWKVQVYYADSSGNNLGAPQNAPFGGYIAVQIDCDYNPIVPVLLWMNNTVHIQTKAFMCSEAN